MQVWHALKTLWRNLTSRPTVDAELDEEIRSYRATRPLLRDTISLTMFQAGYKINVIPEQAELSLDCRLLPDTDERAFVERLKQIVDDPAITFEFDWPNATAATAPFDLDPVGVDSSGRRFH